MAITWQCDGCGKTSEGELTCLGHVVKRDYCPGCLVTANVFLSERDEIRKRLVESFKTDVTELIKRFGQPVYPAETGFKLPDVA